MAPVHLANKGKPSEGHYIPRGVRLDVLATCLREGIQVEGSKEVLTVDKEWRTEDFCTHIVKQVCCKKGQPHLTFTDVLVDRFAVSPKDHHCVFVSHAWAYSFNWVLEILLKRYERVL